MHPPTQAQKTNAMRELERAGIAFDTLTYTLDTIPPSGELGCAIAALVGEDPDASFKTLVAQSTASEPVVCCIPVASELDLKKAAAAAHAKSLSLIHVKDLEKLTGYARGAVSPVGMKKRYFTLIDETAELFEKICISGGRSGISLKLSPANLAAHTGAVFADITRM